MANEKISQLPTVLNSAVGSNSIVPLVDSTDGTTKTMSLVEWDKRYNPMTTEGDVIYGGASGVATRLGAGAATKVLQSGGSGNPPVYQYPNGNYADKATNYTLDATTDDIIDFTAAATATLPTAVGISGKRFTIINSAGGYNVTVNTTSSQTISGGAAGGGIILSKKGNYIVVVSDGANWFIVQSSIAPTIQTFTSGSGTYTTPQGVKYIRVRAVGGGGGGGGGGSSQTAGGNGNNTTFGTSTAGGGGGGGGAGGGAGGNGTVGSGHIGISISGNGGQALYGPQTVYNGVTGAAGGGGGGIFGGGAAGTDYSSSGNNGTANTGGGGGGGGGGNGFSPLQYSGTGGGGGGAIDIIINSPAATYAYSVGTGGSAGSAGVSGNAGGTGGSGIIIVEEYYF